MTETPPPSWSAALSASQKRQASQKSVTINVGTKDESVPATFMIRMLTQEQKDQIEERAVRIDSRAHSDGRVKTDTALLKRLHIQFGVVGGPDGWTGSKADIDAICKDVDLRDHLAEAIDKFTQLDQETRIGFR